MASVVAFLSVLHALKKEISIGLSYKENIKSIALKPIEYSPVQALLSSGQILTGPTSYPVKYQTYCVQSPSQEEYESLY
jgi:hypothetical protein